MKTISLSLFQNLGGAAYPPEENLYDYELVVREGKQLKHYQSDYLNSWKWHEDWRPGADNVQSAPALFQNRTTRNYELVVREGNQLQHYYYWLGYRTQGQWSKKGEPFGDNVQSAPAMFQNRDNDNFELVVREGDQLRHYWFGYGKWNEGEAFGENVESTPVMFQNRNGNYELVVREGYTFRHYLRHYWFDYRGNGKWNKGEMLGMDVESDPVMFQNNANGHYELVVREGDGLRHYLHHYWFGYGGNGNWNAADTFGSDVQTAPAMFQNAAPRPADLYVSVHSPSL